IETLQISAEPNDHGWTLNGRLHWVTNLRKNGFVAAAAIEHAGGGAPFILAIPDSVAGLQRSRDLELLGLQSSNTAALGLEGVELSREWLLHEDARTFLPAVRPAFLGLQCGMSIGLARRSLAEVAHHLGASRTVLRDELEALRVTLDHLVSELKKGLLAGRFTAEPIPLFKLRIALAETAASAVQLELQASGGKAYLTAHGSGFARRWRESAFVPIVTPSLVQLRTELHRQASL
ncbi:acyl-CoA dehydrogenase, partial [Pseudomonas carnis]